MPSISRIIVGHNEHSIDTSANLPECRESEQRVEHTHAYVQTYLGFICTHTHTHTHSDVSLCACVNRDNNAVQMRHSRHPVKTKCDY